MSGFYDLLALVLGWKSTARVVPPPFRSLAGQAFIAGSLTGQPYVAGSKAGQSHTAGSIAGQSYG